MLQAEVDRAGPALHKAIGVEAGDRTGRHLEDAVHAADLAQGADRRIDRQVEQFRGPARDREHRREMPG